MRRDRIVVSLFFLSGLSALVYEILWVRLLGLVFGNTVQATTTVLAAFMAGLALGSFLVGRWLDRRPANPLRVYAVLETGIAAAALVFPLYLAALNPVYSRLYDAFNGAGIGLVAARFAACFLFLVIPAGMMGGTLPALAKALVRRTDEVGRRLGGLYAVNTFGGVAGALLCGFVMIPSLGARWTNFLAAAINAAIALSAWHLSKASSAPAPARKSAEPARTKPDASAPPASVVHRRVILASYFIAGFAALALEVIWMRVLLLVFGSTTYAFTVMLAMFLTGIAIGSAIMERWVDRFRAPKQSLGILLCGCAIVVLAMTLLVDRLPIMYLETVAGIGMTWGGDIFGRILVSALLMLPPTVIFGGIFPVIARLAVQNLAGLGHGVGLAYAANTVGAIAGSLVGGFALLPFFGMQRSIELVAGLMAVTGLVVLAIVTQSPVRTKLVFLTSVVSIFAVLTLFGQPWNAKLLSAGFYLRPWVFLTPEGQVEVAPHLWDDRLLYYQEGQTSTVAVHLVHGVSRTLTVDGKIEISTLAADRRLGRLLGHLPALLHPRPRVVFNLGLGGGLTAAALAAHPIDRLDVAEIEPRIIGAVEHFSAENRNLLADPRLRLLFNDGRNHLLLTRERYDVITSDPLEPVVSGAANLFTEEHFQIARQRLADGGLMAQWVPLYELNPQQYLSIVKTFAAVFPHVSVWFTGTDIIMIGSERPVPIDFELLSTRLQEPRVHADMRDIGLDDPARLLGSFLFDVTSAFDFAGVPVNTDAFPYIEFAAPRQRWSGVVGLNLQDLSERKQSLPGSVKFPTPEAEQHALRVFHSQQLAMKALVEREKGNGLAAYEHAREARLSDPGNPLAREVLIQHHQSEGLRFAASGQDAEELSQYQMILSLDPHAIEGLMPLALRSIDLGRPDAEAVLNRALSVYPESPALRLGAARLMQLKGRIPEASRELQELLAEYPDFAPARAMLGGL